MNLLKMLSRSEEKIAYDNLLTKIYSRNEKANCYIEYKASLEKKEAELWKEYAESPSIEILVKLSETSEKLNFIRANEVRFNGITKIPKFEYLKEDSETARVVIDMAKVVLRGLTEQRAKLSTALQDVSDITSPDNSQLVEIDRRLGLLKEFLEAARDDWNSNYFNVGTSYIAGNFSR